MKHALIPGIILMSSISFQSALAEDVWAADRPLPDYGSLRLLKQTDHRRIHQGDARYRFLLGVSIVEHKGMFYSAWGASAKDENDAHSVFAYKTSRDGKVWSEMSLVAPNPDGPDAHSHGVLLSTGDALWAFAPRAHFGDIREYPELRMEVFQFDEQATTWKSKGETAKGFWPLCEPQKMDDGNWIMGGAVPGRWPRCDASVAISQGADLTKWRAVIIPSKRPTWGETTLLVDGPRVQALIRPSADGLPLIKAISRDFGQTWTTQTDSNLPVSASKPYAGKLSNGAHYLIVSIPVPGLGARDTLAIAVGRPGATNFTDLRVIRQGNSPAPRSSGAGIGRQWAYPYATERKGKLYVVYASTKENAELSVLDLQELQQGTSGSP